MKVGIIGVGNLGKSFIDCFQKNDVEFVASSVDGQTYRGKKILSDNKTVARQSDIIFLTVKPDVVNDVLTEIREYIEGKTLVTFAAGLKLSFYQNRCKANVVRAMTNLASADGAGLTAYYPDPGVNTDTLTILSKFGAVYHCQHESELDIITGISGSGIAYLVKFIDMFKEAAVNAGLEPDAADSVLHQTLLGAANLWRNNQYDADLVLQKIASKGGTTEKGLAEMDKHQMDDTVSDIINKTILASKSLGEKYD